MGRDRQGPPRCQVQSPQFFEDVPEEQLWWRCPAEQLRIRRFRPSCDSQFNCHRPSLQELSSLKESRKESQDREILGHLLLRMRDRQGPPRCQVQSPQFFEDVSEEQLWWRCPAEQLRIRRFRPSCDSQFIVIAPPCKNCPRSRNPGKNPETGKFWDTCCFACGTGKVHHASDHDAKCKARNSSKMYQKSSYGGAVPQSNYGSGGFAPPAIPSSTVITPPCKNCPRSRNPGKNPKTGKFWDTCCFACGTGKVHHPSDHCAKCKARNSSKMYQKSSYGGAVPQSNYGSGGFAPPAIPSSTVIARPCKNCPRSRNRGKNPK